MRRPSIIFFFLVLLGGNFFSHFGAFSIFLNVNIYLGGLFGVNFHWITPSMILMVLLWGYFWVIFGFLKFSNCFWNKNIWFWMGLFIVTISLENWFYDFFYCFVGLFFCHIWGFEIFKDVFELRMYDFWGYIQWHLFIGVLLLGFFFVFNSLRGNFLNNFLILIFF